MQTGSGSLGAVCRYSRSSCLLLTEVRVFTLPSRRNRPPPVGVCTTAWMAAKRPKATRSLGGNTCPTRTKAAPWRGNGNINVRERPSGHRRSALNWVTGSPAWAKQSSSTPLSTGRDWKWQPATSGMVTRTAGSPVRRMIPASSAFAPIRAISMRAVAGNTSTCRRKRRVPLESRYRTQTLPVHVAASVRHALSGASNGRHSSIAPLIRRRISSRPMA